MIEVQAQPREKCMVNMFGANPQRADDSASGVNFLSCLTIYERNFFLSFFKLTEGFLVKLCRIPQGGTYSDLD